MIRVSKERRRPELANRVAPINKKIPHFREGFLKKGDDILSHITAVPSAQSGLTSLFGMGRGEPRRNNHLKLVCKGIPIQWNNITEYLNILR